MLEILTNLNLTPKDYIDIGTKAFTAIVTLTAAVKWAKNRLEGIPQIDKNAAAIKRHAANHAALLAHITKKKGPRSILMEGADIIYYAVRGENPPVLSFSLNNEKNVLILQKVLSHIDDPHEAYAIAAGRKESSDTANNQCTKECSELAGRIRKRQERSWLRNRENEKSNAIDEAMLKQTEILANAKNGASSGLTESCHIALKHTTALNPFGDIIVMGITTRFRNAFEKAHGVRDIGTLRNIGDNALFDKILETRRVMMVPDTAGNSAAAIFKKALLGIDPDEQKIPAAPMAQKQPPTPSS